MGQSQPRVIIWTALVVLEETMLRTKFQSHPAIGSGEGDFLRFLPYMGMAAILVMWPGPFEQFFNFETLGCNNFQKIIIFTFSHTKAYVTKFDLCVK